MNNSTKILIYYYPSLFLSVLLFVSILRVLHIKGDMKSYIPLETAAILFLANLFLKQGISSEYVMVDFICMGKLGLQGAKTENYKMKNSCQ